MSLWQDAVTAVRHKDKKTAQQLLTKLVQQEPDNIDAWFLLAYILPDTKHKRQCLNRILKIDPQNSKAQQALADLANRSPAPKGAPSATIAPPTNEATPAPTATDILPPANSSPTRIKRLPQNEPPAALDDKNAPWNARRWRNGRIKPSVGQTIIWWIFGIFLTGFSLLAFTLNDEVGLSLDVISIFMMVMMFSGLGTLYAAINKTITFANFSDSLFTMETMPGVIGGQLKGTLALSGILPPNQAIRIELINLKRYSPQGDNGGSPQVSHLFTDKRVVSTQDMDRVNGRYQLPLEFTIPYNTKDQTDNGDGLAYFWLLHIFLDPTKGAVTPDLEYILPVYRTSESDPAVQRPARKLDSPQTETELADYLTQEAEKQQITINLEGSQKSYILSSWPGLPFVIYPALGAFLFGGWGFYALFNDSIGRYLDGLGFEPIPIAKNLLFSASFILIGYLSLRYLIYTTSRKKNWVHAGTFYHKRTFLGISHTRSFTRQDVRLIKAERSGRLGGRAYYRVVLQYPASGMFKFIYVGDNSHELYLADYLYTRGEANWLAHTLKRELANRA